MSGAGEASAEVVAGGGGAERAELREPPVEALDRLLGPVRRVASWAGAAPRERVSALRYFEEIGLRWVRKAQALDLPTAVREQLDALAAQLEGLDAASLEERAQRVTAVDQLIRRLDAQLGLPLPVRPQPRRRPETRRERPPRSKPAREAPPRVASARSRPERAPVAEAEAPAEAAAEEPTKETPEVQARWTGDLRVHLADLGLPDDEVEALASEDLQTVGQLLRLPPVSEETLAPVHGAGREIPLPTPGEEGDPPRVAVGGRVGARFTLLRPDGTRQVGLRLRGAGVLEARFTRPPSWQDGTDDWVTAFEPERRLVVAAQLVEEQGKQILLDPELAADDGRHTARLQRFGLDVPDRALRRLIRRLLDQADHIRDPLPQSALAPLELPNLSQAVRALHEQGSRRPDARRRLAFDELVAAQISLSARRFQASRDRGIPHTVLHGLMSRLGAGDPLILDDEQQLAFEDIKRDLRQPTPMMRVLIGEIGVGRGVVATMTAVSVAESKSQVLVVSPDRATAEQRFAFAEPLLREAGLVARFVEDGGKRSIRDAIGRGEVHVVFGDLELLEQGLEFRRLGLVIAEEREQWGRASAAIRKLRAPRPHALLLPTTPIGAAVALTAYHDHDITVLAGSGAHPARSRASARRRRIDWIADAEEIELYPPGGEPQVGRVRIDVRPATERQAAYALAAHEVQQRRQVVVVFPMVRGQDALTLREAMRVVRALEEDALQGARVVLYHGSMPREERHRIYDDFRHRRSDVLVATTLVEDGPHVPDVSLVVVEQADRVDRIRLQRIRGYVARSRHPAGVVLVVGEMSDEGSAERLQLLVQEPDGFALHEATLGDAPLETLIAGDVPPLPTFAWADLVEDRELLWKARELAHEVLRADPALRRGWGAELARVARSRFDELWPSDDDSSPWRCPIPEGPAPDKRRRRRRRRRR